MGCWNDPGHASAATCGFFDSTIPQLWNVVGDMNVIGTTTRRRRCRLREIIPSITTGIAEAESDWHSQSKYDVSIEDVRSKVEGPRVHPS